MPGVLFAAMVTKAHEASLDFLEAYCTCLEEAEFKTGNESKKVSGEMVQSGGKTSVMV